MINENCAFCRNVHSVEPSHPFQRYDYFQRGKAARKNYRVQRKVRTTRVIFALHKMHTGCLSLRHLSPIWSTDRGDDEKRNGGCNRVLGCIDYYYGRPYTSASSHEWN